MQAGARPLEKLFAIVWPPPASGGRPYGLVHAARADRWPATATEAVSEEVKGPRTSAPERALEGSCARPA
jgi:hypothetical protein